LLSVVVAVVFAFVVHADAVDLYTTFLRNPGTTASVIAQSEAIKKQFEAAQEAARTADAAKAAADAKNLADGKPPENAPQPVTPDNGQQQIEDARDAAKAAKEGAEKMVKQFANLGVPLGWNDERYKTANLLVLAWSCRDMPAESWFSWWTVWRTCKSDDPKPATTAAVGTTAKNAADLKYTNVWFGIPRNLGVLFYLFLGGLLIGLGAPFWYNVVTAITNIRNAAGGAGGATGSAPQAPGLLALGAAPAEADKAQPATPAGAFQVAQAAKK
jgi:hypothetical protein